MGAVLDLTGQLLNECRTTLLKQCDWFSGSDHSESQSTVHANGTAQGAGFLVLSTPGLGGSAQSPALAAAAAAGPVVHLTPPGCSVIYMGLRPPLSSWTPLVREL